MNTGIGIRNGVGPVPHRFGGKPEKAPVQRHEALSPPPGIGPPLTPSTITKLDLATIDFRSSPDLEPAPARDHTVAVVASYKRALAMAGDVVPVRRPLGPADTRLTPAQRAEAFYEIIKSEFSWEALCARCKETDDTRPLILVRRLQTELVDDLCESLSRDMGCEVKLRSTGSTDPTSDKDYTVIAGNQAEIAISLNESILDIFGVPSGVVMDTNFYTQHSAMETGLTITTPRIQTEWETANFTNAAKKCALQWRNTYDQTTDNFVETRFYQDIVIPSCRGLSGAHQDGVIQLFEHAWNSTLFREVEIQLKIVELAAERSSPSVAGSIFKGTIRQVRSPLTDRHNLKMTATQALYKEKIIESEKKYQAYIVQKDRLNAELDRISAGDAELRAVLTEQLEGPVDWPIDRPVSEEARATLRALKTQMDIAAFESITAQSDADQFAHESYFSQASILAVVGLMQMGGTGPMKIGEPGGPGIRARFPMIDQPRTMQAAALENLGDWIKELGHHGDSPPRFALNGAKYLFRLSNCAGQFLAMGGKTASLSGVAGKQALSKCNIIFDTAKAILSIKKDTKRSPEEKESQALKLFRNLHERIWPGSDSLDDKAIAQDIVSQVTDLITQLAAPPIQDPI